MNAAELRSAYQNFFIKSEGGKYFISQLTDVITTNHEKAEDKPELARDYVQRAKGARELLAHINSVVAERGKVTE